MCKLKMFSIIVCVSSVLLVTVDSARILGVFPMPSVSHQVVFRALTLELAKRGHELVILTPNPAKPTDIPPKKYVEVDVSYAYQKLGEMMTVEFKNMFQRGVLVYPDEMFKAEANKTILPLFISMVEYPEFKKITSDKSQHFDLIIAEAFMNYHLIVSKIFNAPVILFSSLHGLSENFDIIGAPNRHPLLYPSTLSDTYSDMTWIEKLKQIKFEYHSYKASKKYEAYENEVLKQNYGPDAPTVEELHKNVHMLFLNSHPVFCGNRPLPPNAVYVGPLHLQPVKKLPEDLQKYLDNSETGVIYVSLGTNVRPSMMDKDLMDSFLETFKELPYDILWKFDGNSIENLPKNVKIQKWFPQRDLLVHPKIKLFIMQGGLQSTDEAIDAGVPLVGIPMLGDQWYNVQKFVEFGIGVKVDALKLDKDSFLHAINTVLKNDSYRKNVKKLKGIINDNPQTPLERAVWWTEYVIRNGGAKHLLAPAATISWPDYLMLDVLVPAILVLIIALLLVSLAIKKIMGNDRRKSKVKKS